MMILTANEIKRMSANERLRHYEQEKNELFSRIKGMTAEEIRDAHEALREKWRV